MATLEDEATLVVGLDSRTVQFWEITLPLWLSLRPEIGRMRWLIFCDRRTDAGHRAVNLIEATRALSGREDDVTVGMEDTDATTRLVEWPFDPEAEHETQRERMLTGFVQVPPRIVKTRWWLKVDVDAFPVTAEGKWFEPEWIESREHVMVGQKWGYTKPKTQMAELDEWADEHPAFAGTKPLRLPVREESNKCKHPRIASWICLVDTGFSGDASAAATFTHGANHMPVPSQDGFHNYVADRLGKTYRRVDWKRRGWRNVSKLDALRRAVGKVWEQGGVE